LDIQSGKDGRKEIFDRNWPGLFGRCFFLLAPCAYRFALFTLRPSSPFLNGLNKPFPSNNRKLDLFDISYQNFNSQISYSSPDNLQKAK